MSPNLRVFKAFYDQIQAAYSDAITRGVEEPVIVLRRKDTSTSHSADGYLIGVLMRPEVERILADKCPEISAKVASPTPSHPMAVIVDDGVFTLFETKPDGAFAEPNHRDILKRSLESAEMEWLRAKERGMIDPVIEIGDEPDSGESGVIGIGMRIHERESMVATFRPLAPTIADAIALPTPPDAPITIVIETISGVTVVNRPSP